MTPAQNNLYWREWGRAREHFKNQGLTSTECDAKRHALHVKALGRDKSSKSFNNSDLDKVLGVFRAVWDDANLDAQLRQIDQPEQRREDLINRCWDAVRVFIKGLDRNHSDDLCGRYMDGVAERVCKKPFRLLDERELGKVYGILDRRANQVLDKLRREHADKVAAEDRRERDADENNCPF